MRDGLGRDQTVLVLGGTSDIGTAIAHELLPSAGTILLAGRETAALKLAADRLTVPGRRVETLHYDATAPAAATVDVLACAAALAGDLDVVVLAVGALTGEELIGADSPALESSLQTNMLGPMVAVHATAHRLREQGHGTLIVLSSVAAVRTRETLLTYGVAKAALDLYARRIGRTLRGSGARVLVVRPGHVRTRMTAGLPEAPFATTAREVAARVSRSLRRRAAVVYAPAILRPVMATLRVLPQDLMNNTPRKER
ncbi:SDR family NAD(P)-dependent oxidoreductase [Paractinoplanes lichenicola]|uniref:SDR family NAD(P)-dependent oxidoreductase n=1 Tax=Paractinoplanes lichenicola TaxID=2802976 RepID=A0ABS1W0J2_9ACTN|nr:SDR family NAD(P)-dependent oxidoreductase [Actinoplanes lichenicola]MBL7260229.1 SDR family NAD(P)-dependent oxidoreductase [Actinoplanes lichenicola]